jgi:hypothetical protein
MIEHLGGKVAHDGLGLEVEVMKHFVKPPTAKQLDDIGVHMCTKKCHHARSAQRAGRNFIGGDAKTGAKDANGKP